MVLFFAQCAWSYFSLSLLSVHAILLFPQTAWSYFAQCAWSCFLIRLIFTSYSMINLCNESSQEEPTEKEVCVSLCVCVCVGGGGGGG